MNIRYFNALAGAGKTFALAQYADRLARRQNRPVLFVQPTKLLIEKTIEDELKPLNPTYPFHQFHGDVCDGVVSNIVQHFKTAPRTGQIVFVTHAAFMLAPYLHRKSDWVVLFDEVPNVLGHFDRALPQTHSIITRHLKPEDAGSSYVKLAANGPHLREIVENKDGDDVLELFGDVAAQIVSPHWDVHVSQKGYADLTLEAGERLTTHSILKPSLFTGFKSVTLAAACFEETLLYHL